MKEINLNTKIMVYSWNELSNLEKKMINKATTVAEAAYAPYSLYKVGCSVLLDTGEIITGSNQENAAFTAGICAERTALNYAMANYPNSIILSIAIIALKEGEATLSICSPCGECRQVLSEIEFRQKRPVELLLCGREEVCKVDSIEVLLPLGFHF